MPKGTLNQEAFSLLCGKTGNTAYVSYLEAKNKKEINS
jgi:hypothetical protein